MVVKKDFTEIKFRLLLCVKSTFILDRLRNVCHVLFLSRQKVNQEQTLLVRCYRDVWIQNSVYRVTKRN